MSAAAPGRLRLADLDFDIEQATVSGFMLDPYWVATCGDRWDRVALRWSIDVRTVAREIDDQRWRPSFELGIDAAPARWTALEGFEARIDEPHGNAYVFGHHDLLASRVTLGSRDGTRFALRWSGRCEVFWDARYAGDVPFSIEASAEFIGITVRGSERDAEADFDARLAGAIALDGLAREPIARDGGRYESGVAMAAARYRPRLAP